LRADVRLCFCARTGPRIQIEARNNERVRVIGKVSEYVPGGLFDADGTLNLTEARVTRTGQITRRVQAKVKVLFDAIDIEGPPRFVVRQRSAEAYLRNVTLN
jgi:hypothetical protein